MSHYLSQTHYSLFFVSLMHTHSHSLSHYLRTSVQLFYLSSVVVVDFLDLIYLSIFQDTPIVKYNSIYRSDYLLLSFSLSLTNSFTAFYYLSHYYFLSFLLSFTFFFSLPHTHSLSFSHYNSFILQQICDILVLIFFSYFLNISSFKIIIWNSLQEQILFEALERKPQTIESGNTLCCGPFYSFFIFLCILALRAISRVRFGNIGCKIRVRNSLLQQDGALSYTKRLQKITKQLKKHFSFLLTAV
jgi:hypothetical protein